MRALLFGMLTVWWPIAVLGWLALVAVLVSMYWFVDSGTPKSMAAEAEAQRLWDDRRREEIDLSIWVHALPDEQAATLARLRAKFEGHRHAAVDQGPRAYCKWLAHLIREAEAAGLDRFRRVIAEDGTVKITVREVDALLAKQGEHA